MANTVARISHSTQVTTKCSLFWFSFIGPPISQLHKILTEKDKYQDICWSNPEMDDDSSIACKLFWQLVVEPQFVAICWEPEPLYYCAYHSMSPIFLIVNFLCVTRRSLSDDGDWVGQWVSMSCWISAIVLVLGSGNKASAFFRGKKMCCRWWGKEDGGVQRELRIVGKIYSLPQQQWTPLPWDNWLDSNRHKHLNTAIQTKTVIQTNTVIHNSTVIDTNTAMFKKHSGLCYTFVNFASCCKSVVNIGHFVLWGCCQHDNIPAAAGFADSEPGVTHPSSHIYPPAGISNIIMFFSGHMMMIIWTIPQQTQRLSLTNIPY